MPNRNRSRNQRGLDRRRILTLPFLGLAGCLRSTDSDDQTGASEDDESSDASENENSAGESNDDTSELDAINLPPGVNPDGVTPSVTQYHERELADKRFESSLVSVRSSGDTMVEERVNYTYDDNTFVSKRSYRDSVVRVYVEDGEVILQEAIRDSGPIYSEEDPSLAIHVTPLLTNQLFGHFDSATFVPVEWVEHNGEDLLRAVAEDGDELSRLPLIRSPEDIVDFHGEALITANGVIRSLTVDVEKETTDPQSIEISFDPLDASPTIETDWVEQGLEEVTRFDVSLINDGTTVEISHTGGNAPVEYLQVSAWEGGSGTNIGPDFSDGFEAGRTAYLARTEGTHMMTHDEPVSGDELETPLLVNLWAGVRLLEVELS